MQMTAVGFRLGTAAAIVMSIALGMQSGVSAGQQADLPGPGQVTQLGQAEQVVTEVSVAGDDRGAAAEHRVAGEQRAVRGQQQAHRVGGVARAGHHPELASGGARQLHLGAAAERVGSPWLLVARAGRRSSDLGGHGVEHAVQQSADAS